MKILITAAASAQAHQLKSKLENDGNNIVLGDHLDLPAFMVSSGKMIKLANPASPAYTHEMLTLCLDQDIAQLYVFNPDEIKLLMEAEQLFGEYGIKIITNEI